MPKKSSAENSFEDRAWDPPQVIVCGRFAAKSFAAPTTVVKLKLDYWHGSQRRRSQLTPSKVEIRDGPSGGRCRRDRMLKRLPVPAGAGAITAFAKLLAW